MEDWVKDFCNWNPDESPARPVSRARRKTQSQSRRRSLRILRRQSIDCTALNTTQNGESQTDNTSRLFLQGSHNDSVNESGRKLDHLTSQVDSRCDNDDYGTVWLSIDDEGHEGKPAKRRKPSVDIDDHEIGQQNDIPQKSRSERRQWMKNGPENSVTDDLSKGKLSGDDINHTSSAIKFREEVDQIWSDLNAFGSFTGVSTTLKKKTEVSSTVKKRRKSSRRDRRRTIGIPSISCKSLQPLLITPPDHKFNSSKFQPATASSLNTKISVQLMAEELLSPETCRSATPEVQARDMARNLLALEDKSSEVMDMSEHAEVTLKLDTPECEHASKSADLDKGFMSSPFDQNISLFSPATPSLLLPGSGNESLKEMEIRTSEPVTDMMETGSPCQHSTMSEDIVAIPRTVGMCMNIAEMSGSQQPGSALDLPTINSTHAYDSSVSRLHYTPISTCTFDNTVSRLHDTPTSTCTSDNIVSRLHDTPTSTCTSNNTVSRLHDTPTSTCTSDNTVSRLHDTPTSTCTSDNIVSRLHDTPTSTCTSNNTVSRLHDTPTSTCTSDNTVSRLHDTPAGTCISDSSVSRLLDTPTSSHISDSFMPIRLDMPASTCTSDSPVPGLSTSTVDCSEEMLHVGASRFSGDGSSISDHHISRMFDTPASSCIHISDSSVPVDDPEEELHVRVSRLSGIAEESFGHEMECDDDEDRTEMSKSLSSNEQYNFTAIRDIPAPGQHSEDYSSIRMMVSDHLALQTDSEIPQEITDNVSMNFSSHRMSEESEEMLVPVIEHSVMTCNTLSHPPSFEDPSNISSTPTFLLESDPDKIPMKPRSRKRKRQSTESALLLGLSMSLNPEDDRLDDLEPSLAESCDQSTGSRRSTRLKRRSVELFREQWKISETTVDKTDSPDVSVCAEDADSPGVCIQEVELKAGTVKGSVKHPRKKRAKKTEKLEDIYLNKLYKKPNEKMYETIFENPVQKRLISQKRYRRSITFDMYMVQPSKVKRRVQKATKLGWGPNTRRKRTISKSDFDKKMLALEADLGNLNTEVELPCPQEVHSETDTMTVILPPSESGDR